MGFVCLDVSRFSPEPNNGEFYLEKKKFIDHSLAIFFLSSFGSKGTQQAPADSRVPQTQFTSPRFHLLHRRMRSRSYGGGAVPSSSEKKKKRNWRKNAFFRSFSFWLPSFVWQRRLPSSAVASLCTIVFVVQ